MAADPLPADPEARFRQLRSSLAESFLKNGRVGSYLRCNSNTIDRFVTDCARRSGLPEDCAVVAVGGYGRQEMFPFSDIDILILLPEAPDESAAETISAFVTALWSLGLTVGSAVRAPDEMAQLAQEDISVATAFLEARLVLGDEALFRRVRDRFLTELDPASFFRRKMLEMRQRHQKGGGPYALEPDIKEDQGGLRDLQVFLWCSRAAGWGVSWGELAHNGIITPTESQHLARCQRFLGSLRVRLHLLSGRHEDRLIFDAQDRLARLSGYRPSAGLSASEALMKRYYLVAKEVSQLNAILLQAMAERLLSTRVEPAAEVPLEGAFVARGSLLDIRSEAEFLARPSNVLRAFLIFARHRELAAISTRLLRALWHSRYQIDADFRGDADNRRLLLDVFRLPEGTYHCLKNMNVWGVLGRFLPVFRRVVGLMQHDLFHAYTVDQHTLLVIKYLRRFTHSSYAHEYPLCSRAISELPDVWRVIVAGFFHDLAKGRGGNHSLLGEKEALAFGEGFGLSPEDTAFIAFLVREHLTMSRVAQKEDVSDPAVVRRFAELVGTMERLNALFVLTVADIRATSPKVWNSWKRKLLEDLYGATAAILRGSPADLNRATVFARKREHVCELTDRLGIDARARDRFWSQLDIVYFLRHDSQHIAWHAAELAGRGAADGCVVRARQASDSAGLEILVYAPDGKDLFARIVSCFERASLSVLAARVHTTRDGMALDTFMVEPRGRDPEELSATAWLEEELARGIASRAPLPEPKPGRLSRRSRSFPIPPWVVIEPDASSKGWIMQVVCNDFLGVLYTIAMTLARHGISLNTAKITTLDERVEDAFLISGDELRTDEGVLRVENDLMERLGQAR